MRILVGQFYRHYGLLQGPTVAVIGGAVFATTAGLSLAFGLIGPGFALVVTVVGYELFGHKHQTAAWRRLGATSAYEPE